MGLTVRRSCGGWPHWRTRAAWARNRSSWQPARLGSPSARCGGGCRRCHRRPLLPLAFPSTATAELSRTCGTTRRRPRTRRDDRQERPLHFNLLPARPRWGLAAVLMPITVKDLSGETAADPPEARPGQDQAEAEEDRRLVPLEGPVAARRLVDQDLTELRGACLKRG